MSDNYSLIIKNGSCYIDGKLIKSHFGVKTKILCLKTSTFKDDIKSAHSKPSVKSFNSSCKLNPAKV